MNDPGISPAFSRTDQILEATRTMFLRYGYRRTSVDEIAREAGVAKATLYAHFAGKDELFRAMIRRFQDEVHRRSDAAEAMNGPIAERMAELLSAQYCTVLEWFADAAHLHELKLFARASPVGTFDDGPSTLRERVEKVLRNAESSGELAVPPNGVSIGELARILIFTAHGAKVRQREGAKGLRRDLELATRLLLAGALNTTGASGLRATDED
jgi:AcrR family transcriptional regulator